MIRKKIKMGDVFSIATARGDALFQVTHLDREWGHLIRVLPWVHSNLPANLQAVVNEREQFVTFFPLQAAAGSGIVRLIGEASIPPASREFPVFRAAGFRDAAGYVRNWWIVSKGAERKVDVLTNEQRLLPIQELINDTMLRQRIESNWRPELEV